MHQFTYYLLHRESFSIISMSKIFFPAARSLSSLLFRDVASFISIAASRIVSDSVTHGLGVDVYFVPFPTPCVQDWVAILSIPNHRRAVLGLSGVLASATCFDSVAFWAVGYLLRYLSFN